jgi:Zn-dependent M32 family carboxypeptidase
MESWFVLGLVVLGCATLFAMAKSATRKRPVTVASLRAELRRLTHDPRVVESLVSKEQERSPHLSEREVLEVVVRKLKRERRR